MNIVDAIDDPQVFGKHFRQVRATIYLCVAGGNKSVSSSVSSA